MPWVTLPSVLIAILFLGCDKKKDDAPADGSAVLAGGGVVLPPVPELILLGLPAEFSAAANLDVQVLGTNDTTVDEYQYALLADAETCDGATLGEWVSASTKITDEIGADGKKLLCVIGRNAGGEGGFASHAWTNDQTPPVVAVTVPLMAGMGSETTEGIDAIFRGTASDPTAGLASLSVSIERTGSYAGCLNEAKDAFNAACPNLLALDVGATWSISAPEVLFTEGVTYKIVVQATDLAANLGNLSAEKTFVWDSFPPVSPWQVDVAASPAALKVDWTAISDAAGYVVVRHESAALSFDPTFGTAYTLGETAGDGAVAYVGTSTSFTDDGLAANKIYYYSVYAYDQALNYSDAAVGSGVPKPLFSGLLRSQIVGPKRMIYADWLPFVDNTNNRNSFIYKLFRAATSGAQDFAGSALTSVTNGASHLFTALPTSSDDHYLAVRVEDPDGEMDSNSRELSLSYATAMHHLVAGSSVYDGQNPKASNIITPRGVRVDAWGNILTTANTNFVYVRCTEKTEAPYCRGRKVGLLYTLLGGVGLGNPADGAEASEAFGYIYGIDVDRYGNVVFSDALYPRLRVLCFNTGSAAGFCAGKTPYKTYYVAGTGSSGTPTDDSVATSAAIGAVQGVRFDSYGNVVFADETNNRIYVTCTSLSGLCEGKTEGHVYLVAGTGATTHTTSGTATTTAIGNPHRLALDSDDNVYFSDDVNYRIRVICRVASGAACSGKTAMYMYSLAGDGNTANVGDGLDIAVDNPSVGSPAGLGIDTFGNIIFGDRASGQEMLRAICLNGDSTSGYCAYRDVGASGTLYEVAGENLTYVYVNEGPALDIDVGWPTDVDLDAAGNVYMGDSDDALIRVYCANTDTSGVCYGRAEEYMYYVAGYSWTNSDPGDEDVVPAFSTNNMSNTGIDADSLGNLYLSGNYRVNVYCYSTATANNFCYGKKAGYRYTLDGQGGSYTSSPTNAGYMPGYLAGGMGGISVDPWGNLAMLMNSEGSVVRVYLACVNTAGGFCSLGGRSAGRRYAFVGTTTTTSGDIGHDVVADTTTAIGAPTLSRFDAFGNLFFFDKTNFRVRALCYDVSAGATNYCASKTQGKIYRIIGNGSSGDGGDGVLAYDTGTPANSAQIGNVLGMEFDSSNNLWISDVTNTKIRAVCLNTAGGFCSGKTGLYTYTVANGDSTDGASGDNLAAGTENFGTLGALSLDSYDNVFFVDTAYYRIRLICQSTSGSCSGKTADTIYRFAGTGSVGNGYPGIAATSAAFGTAGTDIQPLKVIRATNDVIYHDQTYDVVRMFTAH